MRLDDAGPRTWLLGATAGWAVALWLLALGGMGGRIAPLPDDPALAQALPVPAAPVAGRLGPASGYVEISGRPLLSPDRRPQPFSLEPEGQGEVVEERFDFVLTGVLLTPGLQMAIVQPAGGGESIRLRVGQSPDGAPSWRLVALSPRGAVFEGPDGQQSLELRSYDGGADLRGAPPPMATTPAMTQDAMDMVRPSEAPEADAVMDADAGAAATPEAQVEAIRKRIEARREQLRREARQPPATQQR